MYRIFKNAGTVTTANLPEVLKAYTGVLLKDVPKGETLIPPGFKLVNDNGRQFIRREL